ncbi:MAG: hypothetical protein K8J31_20080, partial [Anaerolineae bacterium]|nr:hypothetical protein [Anaerolineae bacterium]
LVIGLAAAAYRAIGRRIQHDRYLLVLTLLSVGCLGLLMTHNNPYYWIFLMPFIALLGGGLIAMLGGVSSRMNLAQAAAVLLLIALLVSFTLTAVTEQNSDELIALGYTLDDLLPPEIDTVAAWQIYFYGLYPRVMISTENFYMAPVDEWQGVKLPQAVIVTQGLDDTYEALLAYVQAEDMQPAYCFPLRDPIYGKPSTVTVYLPPEYLPEESANTCGAAAAG